MEDLNIVFTEGTEIDVNGRFVKFKIGTFKVKGTYHTLNISQVDYENGKARQLIEQEAAKILAVSTGK